MSHGLGLQGFRALGSLGFGASGFDPSGLTGFTCQGTALLRGGSGLGFRGKSLGFRVFLLLSIPPGCLTAGRRETHFGVDVCRTHITLACHALLIEAPLAGKL